MDLFRPAEPLAAAEFDDAEHVIEKSLGAFVECGRALMRIRDYGLDELKRRGYADFGDYCKQRWKLSRPRAYELINGALVVGRLADVSAMADTSNGHLPANERQVRELTRITPELQPAAWQRAQELAGERDVTAAVVRQARRQVLLEEHAEPTSGPTPFIGDYLNLWTANECDPRFGAAGYPGRMPGQFVQNLLWLYTREGDLVLDPFAGSGTTLDVCRLMDRRCLAFDLHPQRPDIRKLVAGQLRPADLAGQGQASLVLLDPPYWSQKRGEYTAEPADFSNLGSPREFYAAVEHLARIIAPLLDGEGAHVALAVSQSRVGGTVYDLAFESAKRFEYAGYRLVERIVTSYGQAASITGDWIARARAERFLLRGYRDILVFEF